ncbi:uncharacterized protein BXZ73DRAFT_101044 [Epithele typhae]|uniref:uncharacterized protein n=1 Tax=Epithele typhae TaxID=378194 RepID=UPI0020085612|nr:uncharacterized protein BXZ73DRAFT_101044 [Epithele typhae]KAH9933661.1 hypothetical protein BXZ73DRAFT_101044 [Epithele typhae]
MASTTTAAQVANIAESVMGGMFIETFIACLLYGITTLQTAYYFQTYSDDETFIKCLVAIIWMLETAHTAFCVEFVYEYLIEDFGNFFTFMTIKWGVGATVICSVGIATCVQGYYVWRVWVLSGRSRIWAGLVGALIVTRVVFGIASAVLCYTCPSWPVLRSKRFSLVTVSGGLGAAALADVVVAVLLSFYLKRGRHSAPRSQQSDSTINRILLYSVNTGAVTCSASLLCVILFAVQTNSLNFLGLVEIQAKLYANSFLGSLNARMLLRDTRIRQPLYSQGDGSVRLRTPVIAVYQQTISRTDRSVSKGSSDFRRSADLKELESPA